MVDVSNKPTSRRTATARGQVELTKIAYDAIVTNSAAKGDVLGVARTAAILAAKRCDELIPLCHTLPLGNVEVTFDCKSSKKSYSVVVTACVVTTSTTGVEMEALTAAAIACLTIIDMIKAVDRSASVNSLRVIAKTGGTSGDWREDAVGKLILVDPSNVTILSRNTIASGVTVVAQRTQNARRPRGRTSL